MKLKFLLVFSLVSILALGMIGCSDDDDDPVGPGNNDTTNTPEDESLSQILQIDATSSDYYTYVNLETNDVLVMTDDEATSSDEWHIAFSRINGKLNSGESGPGGIKAVDLADLGHEYGSDYLMVKELPDSLDDSWEEDQVNYVMGGWYDYNPSTHALSASGEIYVMHTVDDKYAKLVIEDLRDPSMPPNMGYLTLRYVYQADGSTDLSGADQVIELDGTGGTIFFSFAQGGAIEVDDPMNSDQWDFMLDAYDAKVNSGMHGPGTASIYPMYLETEDFASITTAPVGGGYFSDSIESVFGAPTVPGSEWYDYDSNVHEILSKKHVYILNISDVKYIKLDITNYYKIIDGSPASGWITVRYREF